ncbi:hypothetical protein GQ600_24169 [Phytophthora cactorum]|nr:hypothetical protein GQ600_24169 [Phytophthora cactorum]
MAFGALPGRQRPDNARQPDQGGGVRPAVKEGTGQAGQLLDLRLSNRGHSADARPTQTAIAPGAWRQLVAFETVRGSGDNVCGAAGIFKDLVIVCGVVKVFITGDSSTNYSQFEELVTDWVSCDNSCKWCQREYLVGVLIALSCHFGTVPVRWTQCLLLRAFNTLSFVAVECYTRTPARRCRISRALITVDRAACAIAGHASCRASANLPGRFGNVPKPSTWRIYHNKSITFETTMWTAKVAINLSTSEMKQDEFAIPPQLILSNMRRASGIVVPVRGYSPLAQPQNTYGYYKEQKCSTSSSQTVESFHLIRPAT